MIIQKGIITEQTIYSRELDEDVTLLIYLPSTFSPLYKYSLLIAQDGKDYFMFGKVGRVVEQLIEEQKIDRTIVVGIPYKDVHDRYEKYHPNGSKHTAYLKFLANELVPYLDQEFPTYEMGMGRALIGDSLGGTVSLLAGLTYPHTFGKIAMQSPYINKALLEKIEQFSEPHLLHIYHSIGNKETDVKTTDGNVRDFITPNRKAYDRFVQKGFSYKYEEFSGDHTWTYWQPDLPRALAYILAL
ncbi:enterochelin esterase-like enzyme [Anoxybacillus tepidamans]|uniref:Enterochelin esterase-like enzyme n=1 Tax=Anoxybacteroides tepidamans TaxID=265948 RepID=A0A7W8MW78_9BACL|nr:esterase family protein [Anoxybacillus tepidamans]MBB5326099.1 enterochelin esterase-like enzyme [Anoxybacillus tepidamans]